MGSSPLDARASPAAVGRGRAPHALSRLIGAWLGLCLLELLGSVAGQDMHFWGDLVSRKLSPQTHIQFSMRFADATPVKSPAFEVFDTIAQKASGSSESCQVNRYLPTSQDYLVRICSGGAALLVESVGQSLASRNQAARFEADSGYRFVDFFQLIANLSDTGRLLALQTNGDDAKLSIVSYASGSLVNTTVEPLTHEGSKIQTPRLAPFCTAHCKFFLYDALSDTNGTLVMVFDASPLSDGIRRLNTFVMSSNNVTKYPHKTALITQYVNTVYYLANTPIATFIYPLALADDHTFTNLTKEPQRAGIFSGSVSFAALQTAGNLNQVTVVVNSSFIYFLSRYNPVTILANGLELPKCGFSLAKPAEIVFNGSAGTIRFEDAQAKGSGYMVLVRTPEGGTKRTRGASQQKACQVFFSTSPGARYWR
jgi:hypothetical protein